MPPSIQCSETFQLHHKEIKEYTNGTTPYGVTLAMTSKCPGLTPKIHTWCTRDSFAGVTAGFDRLRNGGNSWTISSCCS